MKVTIGQYSPKQNVRCKYTGRAFGPGMPRKSGYLVQVQDNGKVIRRIPAANQPIAARIQQDILEESRNE